MEQNNVSPEKKDSILKSLAIAGFIGILLLVAWLSIQLVHLFPSAFTSLASLAEGVNSYQETILDTVPEPIPLTVTANTSLVNTGDTMTIDWSEVRAAGSYVFSYQCIEGVAVSHLSELGERAIDCDTNYNIGDINSLTISIESEKNRYADVMYTLAFLRTEDESPRAEGSNVVTVVNTDVDSQYATIVEESTVENETVPLVDDSTPETVSEAAPEETLVESTPTVTTPFEQEFAFTIPVSDPSGAVDLGTTFIAMGEIIGGSFFSGPVSADNAGAIQFEVKNTGTKTSNDWTYSIELPNGDTFESEDQKELKPNERAIITIGFPTPGETIHTFAVSVDESNDRNSNNDEFQYFVIFTE